MAQTDESKKEIALSINQAIDNVLKHGPTEKILRESKLNIEQTLLIQTASPDSAANRLVRYYQNAYETVRKHKGMPFKAILSVDFDYDDKTIDRDYGLSDSEFIQLIPDLEDALYKTIKNVRDMANSYKQFEINDALNDFIGWALTVPFGGTKDKTYRASARYARNSVKAVAAWDNRFFIIHRHDFYAFAEHILACHDDMVIAGIWRWSKYSCDIKEHKLLDGKIFYKRNSWAHIKGIIKPLESEFFDKNIVPGTNIGINGCNCNYQYVYYLEDLPDERKR